MPRSLSAALGGAVVSSIVLSISTAIYAEESVGQSPNALPPVIVKQAAPKRAKQRSLRKKKSEPERTATPASSEGQNSEQVAISPTLLPTPLAHVGSSATILTAKELEESQRRTVPDALSGVPGLNIVQTGGPGARTSVFMRGTNSNHVKVLVDGIDVSDPSVYNGSADFAHLMTGDVARIEVLRGPQSGLYGSDAVGGVISIVTQNGEGPAQAYASTEAGSFGTFNQSAGASGSSQGFNYAFNILHYRAEDVPVTPSYLVPPGETRLDSSYDNMTYSTKLGLEVSKELTLNFVARYIDSTYRYNSLYNYCATCVLPLVQEPEESTQLNRQLWTRGEAIWPLFDGRFKNYFGLAYTDAWTNVADPWPGDAFTSTFEGRRIKYDWRGVAEIAPGQFLSTGVERQNENMNTYPGIYNTGDTAAWAQLQSEWAERLFVNANIRYDDDDSFGGHTTYRIVSAFILPDTGTKLKASYGTGFKAPTLNELHVNYPPFFFANPNLKPEESKGYDAGFEQPLLNGRVRLGSTYFHNSLTNLIDCSTNTCLNIGRAETHGVESFASFAVTPALKMRADHTYTIALNELTGQRLLRRPKDKVSMTASWKAADDVTLSATVNHVSSWRDDYIAANHVPGYTAPGFTTVNMAANYAATDRIALFGRIDNVFNVKYEDPAGYLRPGFGVFAGLKVTAKVADLIEPRQ